MTASRPSLSKAKQIEIKTRQLVRSFFSGSYHSAFKGRGLQFSELRPYQYGDDVRSINWGHYARSDQLYVNVMEEERELTVILAVDVSRSAWFGSGHQTKREVMAEIAAILGFSAHLNGDRVGLLLFSDTIEKYVPPRKSKSHVMAIIQDVFEYEPRDKGTDIGQAADAILNGLSQHAIVCMISDFLSDGYQAKMSLLMRRHELIPIVVEDVVEHALPNAGVLTLSDAETGETIMLNSGSPEIRARYQQISVARQLDLSRFFRSHNTPIVSVTCGEPVDVPLRRYFNQRAGQR